MRTFKTAMGCPPEVPCCAIVVGYVVDLLRCCMACVIWNEASANDRIDSRKVQLLIHTLPIRSPSSSRVVHGPQCFHLRDGSGGSRRPQLLGAHAAEAEVTRVRVRNKRGGSLGCTCLESPRNMSLFNDSVSLRVVVRSESSNSTP